MTYRKPQRDPRRKLSDSEVRLARGDARTRELAMRMIAEAKVILASVPTGSERARQFGMNETTFRRMVRGYTYKDVGPRAGVSPEA